MDTIKSFVERPYSVESFIWTASWVRGMSSVQIPFPCALMKEPSLWAKLMNYSYFRAGLEISIRVNGSKYHYGQIAAVWLPYREDILVSSLDLSGNLTAILTYPHVLISPCEDQPVELRLPFALPYASIPLNDVSVNEKWGLGTGLMMGTLMFVVINEIPPATPAVEVSVFARFVDVSLDGPTSLSYPIPHIVPAYNGIYNFAFAKSVGILNANTNWKYMNLGNLKSYKLRKKEEKERQEKTLFVTQSKVTITKEAEVKSQRGVISGALDAMSNAGKALSVIPGLGSYMIPAQIACSTGATIARAFGYCKPNSVESTRRMLPSSGNYAYATGLDNCEKLAVMPDNQVVSCIERMGGDPKEMELSYIMGTPQFILTADLLPTQLTDAVITTFPVTPHMCMPTLYKGTFISTLQRHVATSALYWRGSMRYTIQVCASAFHSMRLRIVYMPYMVDTGEGAVDVSFANGPNIVMDIAKQTLLSFEVPFVSPKPWLLPDEWLGTIGIYVLNQISYPTTPIPNIYLNIWQSCGPDFQLSHPLSTSLYMNRGHYPARKYVAPLVNTVSTAASGDFSECVSQGLTREELRDVRYEQIIPANGFVDLGMCTGELLTHVKHFTNRYTLRDIKHFMKKQVDTAADMSQRVFIDHVDYPSASYMAHQPIDLRIEHTLTMLEWYSLMFVYSRGSQNFKILNTDGIGNMFLPQYSGPKDRALPQNVDDRTLVATLAYGQENGWNPILDPVPIHDGTIAEHFGGGAIATMSPVSNSMEVTIPWYSSTFASPNFCSEFKNTEFPNQLFLTKPALNIISLGTRHASIYVLEATGEDWEYGYLRGVPSFAVEIL